MGIEQEKLHTPDVIEKKLWEEAEKIATERERLSDNIDTLYKEIGSLRENPNLHDWEIIAEKEKEYWITEQLLAALVEKEDLLQDYLIALAEGGLPTDIIEELFPPKDTKQLSKRKQKILEQRAQDREVVRSTLDPDTLDYCDRFGIDPLRIASHDEHNPNHLTSGRRATGIKGNMSTYEGASRFFGATVDTHGGKVRRRSDGFNGFVGKGGRKIRKK